MLRGVRLGIVLSNYALIFISFTTKGC